MLYRRNNAYAWQNNKRQVCQYINLRNRYAEVHKECVKIKTPNYHENIILEAINEFYEYVRVGTLGCAVGYNYYGHRNNHIDNGLVRNKYA